MRWWPHCHPPPSTITRQLHWRGSNIGSVFMSEFKKKFSCIFFIRPVLIITQSRLCTHTTFHIAHFPSFCSQWVLYWWCNKMDHTPFFPDRSSLGFWSYICAPNISCDPRHCGQQEVCLEAKILSILMLWHNCLHTGCSQKSLIAHWYFSYIMQMTWATNFVVVGTFCGKELVWPCFTDKSLTTCQHNMHRLTAFVVYGFLSKFIHCRQKQYYETISCYSGAATQWFLLTNFWNSGTPELWSGKTIVKDSEIVWWYQNPTLCSCKTKVCMMKWLHQQNVSCT